MVFGRLRSHYEILAMFIKMSLTIGDKYETNSVPNF